MEPTIIDDWFLIWDSVNSWLQIGGTIYIDKRNVEDVTTGPVKIVNGPFVFTTHSNR